MAKLIGMLSFAFAIIMAGEALADNDVKVGGKVKSVNTQGMSFVIVDDSTGNDVIVAVNPATDFEAKARKNSMLSWDRDVEFGYLQVGDWVEVEYSNRGPNVVAEEVSIYR